MKLTDADALADRLDALACDDWNQRASTTWAYALKDLADMVRSQPTVEAIPVKWIKNWMKNELYKSDVIRMLNDWEKTKECEGMNFWEILVKEYEENEID